jgi:endonuclease YncB( thermonuclease family)
MSLLPISAEGAVEVAGRVGRIVDGDTFLLGGVNIRPAGFDAPEMRQKCLDAREREYACGERALGALAALIRGKVMVCIATGKRSYGRLVARSAVDGRDIGWEMVKSGWAFVDPRFSQQNMPAQEAARGERRGMWEGTFKFPWKWRRERRKR